VPGEPIFDFFQAWKEAAARTASMKTFEARQWFIAAAERMADRGVEIASQRKWLTRGFLIWKSGK